MKKYIFLVITVILIILLALLSGCSVVVTKVDPTAPTKEIAIKEETKATKPVVILNERQIKILRDSDLPTDYDELTYTQKKAIVAMEEMLQYADEKYNDIFCYDGYVAKGPLEREHMYAYPKGKSHLVFTITRTEDGFEDDYMNLLVRDSLIDYVREGLNELCPDDKKARFYLEVTNVTLDEVPANGSDFDGNVSFDIIIFVDGASCNEDEIIDLQNKIEAFWDEHDLGNYSQYILLKEGHIDNITPYNYTDYLSDEFYTYRELV